MSKLDENGGLAINAFEPEKEVSSIQERLQNLKKKNLKKVEEAVAKNEKQREVLNNTFHNEGIIEHHNYEFPEKNQILKKIQNNIDDIIDLSYIPKEEVADVQVNKGSEILEEIVAVQEAKELEPKHFDDLDLDNKTFEDDEFVEYLMGHLLRFLQPEDIKKEIYDKGKKNYIKRNIFEEAEIYADYRYIYINEKYQQIFNSIPKNFKTKYTEGYLREAFMVLNVIYAHVPDSDIMDDRSVAEIIVESNDILPATHIYQKPYTIEFFMNLSKYGVYNKIKRLVNDKIVLDQIQSLMQITSMKLETIKYSMDSDVETKDIKELAVVMNSISSKYKELSDDQDENKVAYVFNDASAGIDYSKLVDFEVIQPDAFVDFNFKYYIKAYVIDGDNKKFDGYVYHDPIQNKYRISREQMKIWTINKEDSVELGKFEKEYQTLKKQYINYDFKVVYKVEKEENVL